MKNYYYITCFFIIFYKFIRKHTAFCVCAGNRADAGHAEGNGI